MWDIEAVANTVADVAGFVDPDDVDPTLIEAVLADCYRDEGIAPLAPDAFAAATAHMDEADWQRFAVIATMFTIDEVRAVIGAVSKRMPVRDQLEKGMIATAQALKAVNLQVLSGSMVRAEELARRVARGLGISFEGEILAASAARLAKIDYTRLMANVDAAKASAEEQMAELLKRQEEDDERVMRRRGKW
jgi:hypothetical protein